MLYSVADTQLGSEKRSKHPMPFFGVLLVGVFSDTRIGSWVIGIQNQRFWSSCRQLGNREDSW